MAAYRKQNFKDCKDISKQVTTYMILQYRLNGYERKNVLKQSTDVEEDNIRSENTG